jgi:hypothetical protein
MSTRLLSTSARRLLPTTARTRTTSSTIRFLSTSSSPPSSLLSSKFGLGGHKWTRLVQQPAANNPNGDQEQQQEQQQPNVQAYAQLINASLARGVSLFEAGQEGGDVALCLALEQVLVQNPHYLTTRNKPITITTRVGYRSVFPSDEQKDTATTLLQPGNVLVEEQSNGNQVFHNLTLGYLEQYMQESPLPELCRQFPNSIQWLPLLHNPEVQVLPLLVDSEKGGVPTLPDRQAYIEERVLPALDFLQDSSSSSTGNFNTFGIVSNGLGLPSDHPLHLSAQLILNWRKAHSHFGSVQLPINLLEPHGLQVARLLSNKSKTDSDTDADPLQIIAMRPLTCYPDLGAGQGLDAITCADYALPNVEMTSSNDLLYTHQLHGPPPIYQMALQTAMAHFDANSLLEAKLERELTVEERETMDACKLIQSMLHDLDAQLDSIVSLEAHQDDLYQHIIPLLFDTIEELDELSGEVLQAFFQAYAIAVRFAVAQRTRKLIQQGESAAASTTPTTPLPTYPDLAPEMMLQEFALRFVLHEPSIAHIVVGSTSLDELTQNLDLVEHILQESQEETATTTTTTKKAQ